MNDFGCESHRNSIVLDLLMSKCRIFKMAELNYCAVFVDFFYRHGIVALVLKLQC